MKKFISVMLLGALSPLSFAQSNGQEAVACIGRVVPGARIAKLAAPAPNGQAIIETVAVKKGEYVEAGSVVATVQGIDKAKASLDRAEKTLAAAKTASAIRLQQQKNLIADMEGSFAQTRKVLDEKDPPRREREEMEFEQESLARKISQAKGMLPLVEANEKAVIAADEAGVEEARKHYGEFFVRTPISGEVVEINVNPGEAVGMEGVCEIADTRTMYVEAEVYVSDIAKVRVGDTAEIFSDAIGGGKHMGKVEQISGYVKTNRMFSTDPSDYSNLKVVIAKIRLDKPEQFKNYIGSQVNVRILVK